VAELERWKADVEGRLATKHEEIQTKFEADDERFAKFEKKMEGEMSRCDEQFKINDIREEETQRVLNMNELERDDLADRCLKMEERLSEAKQTLELRIDDRNQRTTDHVEVVEKHLTV